MKIYIYMIFICILTILLQSCVWLQENTFDAQNAKVISSLRTIESSITKWVVMWEYTLSDIVDTNIESQFTLPDYEWNNYKVWYLNWQILWLPKESFNSPYNIPYQIAYIEKEWEYGSAYYQILWFMGNYKDSTKYTAKIRWNYTAESDNLPSSLFADPTTWEVLINNIEYSLD